MKNDSKIIISISEQQHSVHPFNWQKNIVSYRLASYGNSAQSKCIYYHLYSCLDLPIFLAFIQKPKKIAVILIHFSVRFTPLTNILKEKVAFCKRPCCENPQTCNNNNFTLINKHIFCNFHSKYCCEFTSTLEKGDFDLFHHAASIH